MWVILKLDFCFKCISIEFILGCLLFAFLGIYIVHLGWKLYQSNLKAKNLETELKWLYTKIKLEDWASIKKQYLDFLGLNDSKDSDIDTKK